MFVVRYAARWTFGCLTPLRYRFEADYKRVISMAPNLVSKLDTKRGNEVGCHTGRVKPRFINIACLCLKTSRPIIIQNSQEQIYSRRSWSS